jgi:signal transduction histidine kinase
MNVERTRRRVEVAQRSAPSVAAVASLAVLSIALSTDDHYYSPRWPLSITALILALGLASGPLLQRVGGPAVQRAAQPVAAIAALIVVIDGLSRVQYSAPRWPLVATAVLLGLGLAAAAFGRLASGQAVHRSVQPVAALAALIVLVVALSSTGSQWWPNSPRWPLTVTAGVLAVGLAAGSLLQRVCHQAVQRAAHTVAALAALVVLIDALSTVQHLSPRWPLTVTIVILGLGLAASRLTQLAGRPREKVLSARVDELSRTRRGALDVQATELRRIERDLHDGAQARLVALSMKLGRAEDRYAEHPEVSSLLREAREDAAAAIRELRELARGIAPPVLTDRGLEAAVRSLAQRSGAEVR